MFTFVLSSVMHEFVFVAVGRRIRPYMFLFQMLQIPLIYISSLPAIKKHEFAGNLFFWFGMFVGPPLIMLIYLRIHFLEA